MTDDQKAMRISSIVGDLLKDCKHPSEAVEILLRSLYFVTLMATEDRADAGESLNKICALLMGYLAAYETDMLNLERSARDERAKRKPRPSRWGDRG